MTTTQKSTPRVYVGTYAKYNNGSIEGKWLDLEDYSDRDEFLAACRELHKDEADPELMFQDFEGFPKAYYGECSLHEGLWHWLEQDEGDRNLLELYVDNGCGDADTTIDEARENFAGRADSLTDWVSAFLEETGDLNEIPERLRSYFDYEAYARDLEMGGDVWTVRHEGETWVFWNR